MPTPTESADQVRDVIESINRAWREGRPDDLRRHFHQDIVIAGSALKPLAQGREACIQSYRDFISQATIQEFDASELEVHVFDGTAVAVYGFEIVYTLQGQQYRERGRDSFVFVKGAEGWQAVWRTVGTSVPVE